MNTPPKFQLGELRVTPGVIEQVDPEDALDCLVKHASGDWSELPAEDRKENEIALRSELRIWMTCRDRKGVRFWIVTEADRSFTTIKLPVEI